MQAVTTPFPVLRHEYLMQMSPAEQSVSAPQVPQLVMNPLSAQSGVPDGPEAHEQPAPQVLFGVKQKSSFAVQIYVPGVLVGVAVAVSVGVAVGVAVAVLVGVSVGVAVAVSVGVAVAVSVGVAVAVLVGVSVGVAVAVLVGVFVGVLVAVAVDVAVGVAQTPPAQT
jgi:hypothetical protein